MSPLSKNAGFTGYALSLGRAGDFATWVSTYNGSDAVNASAGYRANNNVANLALYLTRATSSSVIFQADSGCSGGILINSVSSVGSLRMATSGVERMRIDAQGTVKFPKGLTYSSLTGSTPAKPTETIGLLNYDSTSGVMTLGSWSSGADALMTFITTKGGTASERMRIDPAGNVAIGDTSSSQCRFNVYDSLAGSNGILAHFRNTKADTGRSGAFLQITQAGVQDWTIGQPPDTDAFTIYAGAISDDTMAG
jgi:hypothetical protein